MTTPFADLETIYERLAAAIDAAGPQKSEVFLAKVILLLAEQMGNTELVLGAIEVASQDL